MVVRVTRRGKPQPVQCLSILRLVAATPPRSGGRTGAWLCPARCGISRSARAGSDVSGKNMARVVIEHAAAARGDTAAFRGPDWSAAVSRAVRDQPQRPRRE